MGIIQKDKIILKNINEIKPYTNNPRKHSDEQINKIAVSIREYGFDQPIVIDKDNIIIKGHGRYLACKNILKLNNIPVIVREDLTPGQIKASRLADNRVNITTWDIEKLGIELDDLNKIDFDLGFTGFDNNEIKAFNINADKDFNDPYKEYQDMPNYDNKNIEGYQIISVHFRNIKDVEHFAELIKQKITPQTKYIWIPELVKGNVKDLRYIGETK